MAGGDGGRERSVSQSLDIDVGSSTNTILTNSSPFKDSDQESQAPDDVSKPAKPGRKKNPNSQAARRDQNRIAQREFRLRKQQRIRDLEARVELLSGGKDEAMGEMKNVITDLMTENQTLRNLIRGLAGFIGEGTGGVLPKLGWDSNDFSNFINRSETDTAWEGYQRRKKLNTDSAVVGSGPSTSSAAGQKRPAEDEHLEPYKKLRPTEDLRAREAASFSISVNGAMSASPNFSSAVPRHSLFSDMRGGPHNSSLFVPPPPAGTSPAQYPQMPPPTVGAYPSYISSPVSIGVDPQPMSSLPFNPSSNPSSIPVRSHIASNPSNTAPTQEQIEEEDETKTEAYKLINYHLENFKRNSGYCLPSSLRPTLVQKTVPHEGIIDKILHPELRDRMILLRDRYDLSECLLDYRSHLTIHGDDVLTHTSWEIGEGWLRKYGFLVDAAVLAVTNRWRKVRDEPELRLSDFAGADTPGGSS